jgi:hypothetical protein
LLDIGVPVDCGEALIIATAEWARDLPRKPVYIHAMSLGRSRGGNCTRTHCHGPKNASWISLEGLWAERSELGVEDMDLFFPCDGYSINAVALTEATGFCNPGEASDLFESSWDADRNILKLLGENYVSTNGGNLSHGRAGGFNYYAEAVR